MGRRTENLQHPAAMHGEALRSSAPAASGAAALLVIMIIPSQFSFTVGDVLFTPTRMVMLAMLVPILIKLANGACKKIYYFDIAYVFFSVWTCLCMILNYGFGGAIQRSGQFFMETVLIYFMVVVYIKHENQLVYIMKITFLIILFLGVISITETFGKYYWLSNYLNSIVGKDPINYSVSGERAGGLYRAITVFSHPILYGAYTGSSLAMLWAVDTGVSRRVLYMLTVVIATIMALSSAPLLVLALQLALLIYERATRKIKNRVRLAIVSALGLITLMELGTNRGAFGILTIFTFNSGTAWVRYNQWIHGIQNIKADPIFGRVLETWVRPWWMHPSIDSFWLVQAMIGGLPSVAALILSLWLMQKKLYKIPDARLSPVLARLRTGWGLTMISLLLVAATVHFFDKLQPYFSFVIGIGAAMVRLAEAQEAAVGERRDVAQPVPPRRRRSALINDVSEPRRPQRTTL